MFEVFKENFVSDKLDKNLSDVTLPEGFQVNGWCEFMGMFSGKSFNNGLYRVHSLDDLTKWNSIIQDAFPEYKEKILCFGYDWLGRHFALDKGRVQNGQNLVLMFEPGTGEALEIPVDFIGFHNDELINYCNEALAVEFYNDWLNINSKSPSNDECIGYIKPLFLGGSDTVNNLEVADMEVYWGICGQLINKVKGLPPGTSINSITF